MGYSAHIGLVVVGAAVLLAATGWWRWGFAPFGIRRSRMTIERLGFAVRDPEHVERVNGILEHFAGGFNAMISRPSRRAWVPYCDALPPVYRPFAHEGAAMGYTLRRLFRYDPADFEAQIVQARRPYVYLSYVGLGFWSAMRGHDAQRLAAIVEGLDPLHGHLCYDGYGFKFGFFDYLAAPGCLRRFEALEGYARHAAYQGVGRSFWFAFMDDREALVEHVERLGAFAGDAAAGLGLASAFVFPDRLATAQELGQALPDAWHDDFHLGMCFGLKARSLNDPEEFARNVGRLDADVASAVHAAIAACDQAEKQVRADGGDDGYRRWRELVTEWMASRLAYPLMGVKSPPPMPDGREPVSVTAGRR